MQLNTENKFKIGDKVRIYRKGDSFNSRNYCGEIGEIKYIKGASFNRQFVIMYSQNINRSLDVWFDEIELIDNDWDS